MKNLLKALGIYLITGLSAIGGFIVGVLALKPEGIEITKLNEESK